jgi:predicted site-specific integrase-resolvase
LLPPADAAEMLGVSERTLEGWRRRGTGPRYVVLPSRRVRYADTDIMLWLAARQRRSTSDPGA